MSATALKVSEKTPRYLYLVLTRSAAVASIQGIIRENLRVNGFLMDFFLRSLLAGSCGVKGKQPEA